MGLVDKVVFEDRGARGCSNSDYTFAITTCCERIGVIDEELDDFYWSADSPSKSITLCDGAACPFCDASTWKLNHLEDIDHVPEHWRWACDNWPRPGSRRILPLTEHVRELVAFCRRVSSPMPAWDAVRLLDTSNPHVHCDRVWTVPRAALATVSEFAPRFETLLLSGYSWVNLSAYGMYDNDLIVGVELPHVPVGTPAGLTAVNYSGPARGADGITNWALNVTVIG